VLRRAVAHLEAIACEHPDEPLHQFDLASHRSNLAEILFRHRKRDEAETIGRIALEQLKALERRSPNDPSYRERIGVIHAVLGFIQKLRGRIHEGEESLRQAAAYCERLSMEYPDVPEYRRKRAYILNELGILLMNASRLREARDVVRQVVAVRETLAHDNPGVPRYQSDLGGGLHELGMLAGMLGDPAEKRHLLEQALEHQRAALEVDPRFVQGRFFLGNHYHELTKVLVELGDHAEAVRRVDEMVKADLSEKTDEPGMIAYIAAFHLVRCVRLARQDKRLSPEQREQAISAYGKRADALFQEAAHRGANSPNVLSALADLLLSLPSPDAAREHAMALDLARRTVELDSKKPSHWQILGLAEYRHGHWDAAIQAIEKGVDFRRQATPSDWLVLAMAHAQRGEIEKVRDCVAQLPPTFDEKAWDTSRPFYEEATSLLKAKGALPGDGTKSTPKTRSASK
jgi:tetratricopeptide (TPR) repeat protein